MAKRKEKAKQMKYIYLLFTAKTRQTDEMKQKERQGKEKSATLRMHSVKITFLILDGRCVTIAAK